MQALASSNAESGHWSIIAKFNCFWAYCAQSGTPPIPAEPERVLAFIQHIRAEGRISVRSAPQYVSAITTVHRWFALPQFSATTTLTNALIAAWRLAVVDLEAHDQVRAFPVSSVSALMATEVDTSDL